MYWRSFFDFGLPVDATPIIHESGLVFGNAISFCSFDIYNFLD